MELRRLTMANATATFSIIAHEAWGHKLSDTDNEDSSIFDDEPTNSNRFRQRYKVSKRSNFDN